MNLEGGEVLGVPMLRRSTSCRRTRSSTSSFVCTPAAANEELLARVRAREGSEPRS